MAFWILGEGDAVVGLVDLADLAGDFLLVVISLLSHIFLEL